VDDQIERYLRVFGAVEIAGTKWCGKTWSARQHGVSMSRLDDRDVLQLAQADPSMVLLGERPHVIDEWQRVPAVWDAVRHGVDEKRGLRGAWILTGSSSPRITHPSAPETERHHSGAGRIGRIRMLPMTLQESGDSTGAVSLAGLFEGKFEPQACEADTQGLVNVACRGGWPEAVDLSPADAQLVAREYLQLLWTETVPDRGMDGWVAERIAASLVRNLGQSTTYKTVLADAFGAEDNPAALLSERQVGEYLALFERLYLTENVPGWAPPARSKQRLQTKPKRYLADPSLAVAALGMSPQSLLADWQTLGLVFENLCIRDLTVYARSLEYVAAVPVRYYRDDAGLEVDAVVELADGRWGAFEIKLSENKADDGLRSLRRLRKKLCENPAARTRPPEFLAVLVGIGRFAYQVEDGLYVIPVRTLGR
jgi:hypothetical protein